ncbi:helix-turn-helix transcriptional regulator [Halorarius halobius]|uniref:helix-turn-helix transcriptional regulator n=1 Tax=Halorarius halobius TaxID=2962671 RepID=UPI0020CF486D|nr:helix-turn-helix transcriptional regulator [Halorarius halobius]
MDGINAGRTSEGRQDTDEKLSRLFDEIQSDGTGGGLDLETPAGDHPEQEADELLESSLDALFADAAFRFDEKLVKQSLEELLVVLIAMRSGETNGKALMSDLSRLFDSQLSPGTVYPALHEMDGDDVLEMFELVRSKEYRIADDQEAAAMVTEAAQQYLALGAFLYAATDEL